MAEEWLTYAALAERLGVSPEAARQKAIRARWPRRPGNNGKAQVRVDVEDVLATAPIRKPQEPADARPTPEQTPEETPSDARAIAALEDHLATLRETVMKAEGMAERERIRADSERANTLRLADEVADAARQLARAVQEAAELERGLRDRAAEAEAARVRAEAELAELRMRPWWRRLAG